MKKLTASFSIVLAAIYMVVLFRITMRWAAQEGIQAAYHLVLPVFPCLAGLSLFRINSQLSARKWTIWIASGTAIALTLIHLILIFKMYPKFFVDGIYVWTHLMMIPFWMGLPLLGMSFIVGLIADYIRNNIRNEPALSVTSSLEASIKPKMNIGPVNSTNCKQDAMPKDDRAYAPPGYFD
jgi:hypothetical protein